MAIQAAGARVWRGMMLAAALAVIGTPASAQIRIGQTAGFTGAVAAGVKEVSSGAKLYLDAINLAGGVAGQTIELIALDDKFEPALAAENAKKLIDQGVIALFLTRGTPHTQAVLPLLAQYKVPLIGPSTGAMALHVPVHPWVFNVRATYQREAERAVRHLSLIGMDRIAIVQVEDTFGSDAAQGALKGFAGVGKQPVLHEKFDRSKPDMAPMIPKILKADAQAVLFVASGSMVADGVKLLRAAGLAELTPAMLEGYAAAKVLVEGLRRASPNPTRDKLKTALESFRRFDLGGLELSYTPTDHSGLDYADLSIVGEDGKFRR